MHVYLNDTPLFLDMRQIRTKKKTNVRNINLSFLEHYLVKCACKLQGADIAVRAKHSRGNR